MLLHVPYNSYEPVIKFINDAADDPTVLAIKMTLYRTSGDSPIVRALERAARAGKHVTVFVEIKARFDEARNISWARRLEDVGVIVVYGIARLKVHAKILLVVRKETDGIRRYGASVDRKLQRPNGAFFMSTCRSLLRIRKSRTTRRCSSI